MPRNMIVQQDDLKVVSEVWIYLRHSVEIYFHMFDSWDNNQKILLVLAFPKCCLPLILHISGSIESIKRRPHFGYVKDYKVICDFNSIILSSWINVANYFKDQRRPSSRLTAVMFRETPCSFKLANELSGRINHNFEVWLQRLKDVSELS